MRTTPWKIKRRLLPIVILLVLITGFFLDKMVITPHDENENIEQFTGILKISLKDKIEEVEPRSHGLKTAVKIAGNQNDWKVFHVEPDSNHLYFDRLAVPGDSVFKEAGTNVLTLKKENKTYNFLIKRLGAE